MQDLHSEQRCSPPGADPSEFASGAETTASPDPPADLAGSVRKLLIDGLGRGRETASGAASALGEQIRQRPGPALIAAASIGLIAGFWFARRSARREREFDAR